MNAGFAKTGIMLRMGVQLCGVGLYINRHSITIRERFWASAMAVEQDGKRWV